MAHQQTSSVPRRSRPNSEGSTLHWRMLCLVLPLVTGQMNHRLRDAVAGGKNSVRVELLLGYL